MNGKNVLYYSNETGLTVPFGAGQVIFANCSNMRVENQDLSNGTVGVLAGFSSYVTISNITISNKVRVDSRYLYYSNIYLDNCDNSTVSNCKTSGNNRNIHLQRSYNNTLSGNTVLDSDYGIRLDRSNNNTISSNIISENDVGIYIEGSCQNTSVHHNSIYGNTGYGIRVSSYDSSFIDATDNWWGARTGPRHSINNSRGDGDVVSDYVTFDPWADKNLLAATIIDSISPNPAWDTDTVEFKGHAADDTVVDRYVWTSSLDGEIHNSTECNFTSSSLSPGEHRIYLKVQDNNKAWSEEVSTSLTILKDSDRDGVIDEEDAFPADPVASKDSDGDGYPDSWNPGKTEEDSTTDLKLDAYPDDPDKWEKEEEDDSPGFGVLLMVLVLVGAGLVRKSASSSNKRTKQ